MVAPQIPGSFIGGAIARIREITDEWQHKAKYSDGNLAGKLCESWRCLQQEFQATAQFPPIARFDISIVAGTARYWLPPNIASVTRLAKYNATTGVCEWEAIPENPLSPLGPGWRMEGLQLLRFEPVPRFTETWTLEYIPGGNVTMFTAALQSLPGSGIGSSTWLVPTTATEGSPWLLGRIDHRPNYPLGHYLRLLQVAEGNHVLASSVSDSLLTGPGGYPYMPVQERQVTAFDVSTRALTVTPAFDFDPSLLDAHTYFWELVPTTDELAFDVMALQTAWRLLKQEKNRERAADVFDQLRVTKRAYMLKLAQQQLRWPNQPRIATVDNTDFITPIGVW